MIGAEPGRGPRTLRSDSSSRKRSSMNIRFPRASGKRFFRLERFRRPLCALAAFLLTAPAAARILVTQERALAEAFPAAVVQRRTAYLTDDQAARVEKLSGSAFPSRIVPYYIATRDGGTV